MYPNQPEWNELIGTNKSNYYDQLNVNKYWADDKNKNKNNNLAFHIYYLNNFHIHFVHSLSRPLSGFSCIALGEMIKKLS